MLLLSGRPHVLPIPAHDEAVHGAVALWKGEFLPYLPDGGVDHYEPLVILDIKGRAIRHKSQVDGSQAERHQIARRMQQLIGRDQILSLRRPTRHRLARLRAIRRTGGWGVFGWAET